VRLRGETASNSGGTRRDAATAMTSGVRAYILLLVQVVSEFWAGRGTSSDSEDAFGRSAWTAGWVRNFVADLRVGHGVSGYLF
jgi:hypothetical protein